MNGPIPISPDRPRATPEIEILRARSDALALSAP